MVVKEAHPVVPGVGDHLAQLVLPHPAPLLYRSSLLAAGQCRTFNNSTTITSTTSTSTSTRH